MKKIYSILFLCIILFGINNLAEIYALAYSVDTENSVFQYFGNPIEGGDGYPDQTISWVRIDDVFNANPQLRYNYGSYKLAILDTGFDKPTWTYFASQIPYYWLDLKLIDKNGNYVSRYNAYDVANSHHGTAVTSLIIQMLERQAKNVYASIYNFICTESPYGDLDPAIIEDQLNWIIDFNNIYTSSPIKVISMSFGSYYYGGAPPCFYDELQTLFYDHDCILVAASGNSYSEDQVPEWRLLEYENRRIAPACFNEIIGVGGIYGPEETEYFMENYRMSVTYYPTTDGLYVGSLFYQDVPLPQVTVLVTAPAYKIEMKCDLDDDGTVDDIQATGTSVAAPQVAVAAYLAARMRYYNDRYNPLTPADFCACLFNSAEYDPLIKYESSSLRKYWEKVAEPTNNILQSQNYYSYRVGYGSLDIDDLIDWVIELS